MVEGVGLNGWVKVSDSDWVHVAIGNERLIKGGIKSPKFALETTGGKCRLKKGQEQQVIALAEKWPVSSIVFVTVDDELALCYSLGGEHEFIKDIIVSSNGLKSCFVKF